MLECPVCGASERSFALRQQLLGSYDVSYHSCRDCGLLQTESPHWLEEAYKQAIADTDTGLMQRNLDNARFLNLLLQTAFDPSGRFVDVAGGYGVLARILRDRGFETYRVDKYCSNLFAIGFEPMDNCEAEALFAFEVLEHVTDPVGFIEAEFARYRTRTMILSTLTFTGDPPASDWWYYATDTGQHISFYQSKTLEFMAKRLNCNYVRLNAGLHLMTDKLLSRTFVRCLQSSRVRALMEAWFWAFRRRPSLTGSDHEAAKLRIRSSRATTE